MESAMTILDEINGRTNDNGHAAKPVARAWQARFEHRLAELAAAGEQRTAALRDAVGEFVAAELATRDSEIATLKAHIVELERRSAQKSAVDQQVEEIVKRLDARQFARDEARRGPKGDPGATVVGPRGVPGPRGPAGRPAKLGKLSFYVHVEKYRVVLNSDGKPLATLNLRPLFERFVVETGGGS